MNIKAGVENNAGSSINPELTPNKSTYVGVSFPVLKGLLLDQRRATLQQSKLMVQMNKQDQLLVLNDLLFDAADVLRFGKDLVVQHGFTTNLKGIDWLKRHYKDHRVHAVNFPGDPYPIHIDATFTPIKEGLIINNPQRRLPKEQRKLFENNGWEIIDSAQPAHNEPPPLCYSSTWLSMNVLVLDPKTVCVEKSEVYQAEQLDKLGMEVIPVEMRDAYAFGGGLHCCTADVYREGELKDYFPKQ